MKQRLLPLLLLVVLCSTAFGRTLEVRPGGTYTNLQPAAADALPGDTILFREGEYPGGQSVSNLQGTQTAWITIIAEPGKEVVLRGGANAWHLSDPAYLIISGFILADQTGNGFNIDDAGTFDTPAHHVILERCLWRGIDATGNNDLLKLSGLDSFRVRDCTFQNGAAGGSMIDMVGCHSGLIERNTFERGGSNAIQAKGGTRYIRIERNSFVDAGARAINIGGSTGRQFFRPLNAFYESANIGVYSNVFVGSEAPVAYVGTINSEVVNNTFWLPTKWVLRILQETTDSGFVECGDNAFRNNIVVVGGSITNPFNVGVRTRPETFLFTHNLWWHQGRANWTPSGYPAPESNGIVGRDPLLVAPPVDMTPRPGSPALGAGAPDVPPRLDFTGSRFGEPPSIGAIEPDSPTSGIGEQKRTEWATSTLVTHEPSGIRCRYSLNVGGTVDISIFDMHGARRIRSTTSCSAGTGVDVLSLDALESGSYICVVNAAGRISSHRFEVVR